MDEVEYQGLDEETTLPDTVSAEEELDLTGEGTPAGRFNFTITGFEVSEKQNGIQHVLTFEAEEVGFPLSIGYWFTHTNEIAQRAGRGNLKRISRAATGQPKYRVPSGAPMIGRQVSAEVYEDGDGFARLRGFRPPVVEANGNTAVEE